MLTTSHGEIEFIDGLRLTGTFHIPESQPIVVVLIAYVLGVPRRLYAKISSYLAEKGFVTLTSDCRGRGDSLDRKSGAKGVDLIRGNTRHEYWPVERPGEMAEQSGKNQGCSGALRLNTHYAHQGNPAGESFRGDSHARLRL